MPTKPKATSLAEEMLYDPTKRYSVTLARYVEHQGMGYRPGPNPIEMSGDLAKELSASIAKAHELPPAPDHPDAPASVHEAAD